MFKDFYSGTVSAGNQIRIHLKQLSVELQSYEKSCFIEKNGNPHAMNWKISPTYHYPKKLPDESVIMILFLTIACIIIVNAYFHEEKEFHFLTFTLISKG